MKMILNENAIQFFRGIRNISNEKWQFTGKKSMDRLLISRVRPPNRQVSRWKILTNSVTDGPLISLKEQEIEIRENKVLKVTIKAFGGQFNS